MRTKKFEVDVFKATPGKFCRVIVTVDFLENRTVFYFIVGMNSFGIKPRHTTSLNPQSIKALQKNGSYEIAATVDDCDIAINEFIRDKIILAFGPDTQPIIDQIV